MTAPPGEQPTKVGSGKSGSPKGGGSMRQWLHALGANAVAVTYFLILCVMTWNAFQMRYELKVNTNQAEIITKLASLAMEHSKRISSEVSRPLALCNQKGTSIEVVNASTYPVVIRSAPLLNIVRPINWRKPFSYSKQLLGPYERDRLSVSIPPGTIDRPRSADATITLESQFRSESGCQQMWSAMLILDDSGKPLLRDVIPLHPR